MSPLFRARTPKTRYMVEPDHLAPMAWVGVSCLILLISLVVPDFGRSARLGFIDMMGPVLSMAEAPYRAIRDHAHHTEGMRAMQRELDALRAENARLSSWYHVAQRLYAENAQLRLSARRVRDPDQSYVTARVLMDQQQPYLRTVLVAAGRDDGVMTGQAVLVGDALVGRVQDVSGSAARLMLITDASSRIPVMVERTGVRAILAGRNSDTPHLVFLPVDADIMAGDRVVTSGHGGVFPPYIPVGTVSAIGRDKADASVALYADLSTLDLVRIVDYSLRIDLPLARGGGQDTP